MISRRKLAEHVATRLVRGDAVHDVLQELAAYLLDTGRTSEVELVVRAVEDTLLAKGVALVTVTSARALSADAKSSIEQFVRGEYTHVQDVIMREEIDQSVLAGVKVRLAGAQFDATAKTKLEKLGV